MAAKAGGEGEGEPGRGGSVEGEREGDGGEPGSRRGRRGEGVGFGVAGGLK